MDIFGRYFKEEGKRGPPGVGFKITENGDYDVKMRRLQNVAETVLPTDVTTLKSVHEIIEGEVRMLKEKGERGLPGVSFAITYDGDYDMEMRKLRNVAEPVLPTDVATLESVQRMEREIKLLKNLVGEIYSKMQSLRELIGSAHIEEHAKE